jgi:PAS domain S-box-containing protein
LDSKSVDRNLPVVLIVDDRDENLFAFEIAIRPLSCQSVKCHSGREALDYLATHEVAVILLDVQMPEMSGLEVAAIIRERENSKSTPILFITAIDRADDHAKQAYKLGAVDFIYKPADPYALRAKVGFFVELFRKTKELEDKSHLLESSAEAEKTFILEHALDAVIATDSDNRVTFWNEHAQRLFGWTKSEIMGVDMVDVIIPKEYRDRHRDGVRRFLTTGVPKIQHRRIEIPGLRKNGEQFLMELTVSSVNGPSGMRFYSFLRDITTQRLAQKQIVDSERTLEQIFSESYSWMSLLSVPDFRFLRSNAQHEKLFGKTDYIGKTLLEVEPEF